MPKLRDNDPVRIYGKEPYLRIQYYDTGVRGIGRRLTERQTGRSRAEAMDRADEIRALLRGGGGRVPRHDDFFSDVCHEYIRVVGPTLHAATLKAYRRDLNAYIRPAVWDTPVRELSVADFARIVDRITAEHLSRSTLDGAVRTLNAVMSWATPRRWMPATAFGTPAERREVLRGARARLPAKSRVTLAQSPTAEDVEAFAEGLEVVYPGRGGALIRLMACSGLRLGEALALRPEDCDVQTGAIRVERQADRLAPWPAMSAPKTGERTCYVWASHREVLEDAVNGAPGEWLFPPHIQQFGTRGLWWTNRLTDRMTAVRRELGWPERGLNTHSLRHHFATYSLASRPTGKQLPVALVSQLLGHRSSAVTLSVYDNSTGDAADLMAQLSG